MALDGAFLHHLKNELEEKLIGGRVDKIHQPTRDEFVIAIRTRKENCKLLMSARPDTARIHLTKISLENPKQPPMLCMLLRKKLSSAKLLEINQVGLERSLSFVFESVNELGDIVRLTLVIEIMGKHSNIILVDEEGKIVDALKRVDAEMSSERLIFPGLLYRQPPKQDKFNILETDTATLVKEIKSKNAMLNKALMATVQGISPIVSREIEHICSRGNGVSTMDMTNYDDDRLVRTIDYLRDVISKTEGRPYIVESNKPMDFSFLEIKQYGESMRVREEASFSELLDRYYEERDRTERMRVKSADILKILSNRSQRLERKMNLQKMELLNCDKKEEIRIKADLVNSSLHLIKAGNIVLRTINYYDPDMKEIEIKLNPAISGAANAQKLYKDYAKAKTAEVKLKEQIEIAEKEIDYVDTIFYSLTEAKNEEELSEIRTELEEQGYVRAKKKAGFNKKTKLLQPIEFMTSEGYKVLVGRNNKQNDKLTLKDANRNDIWFHTKDIPGSHTVLVLEGNEPTNKAIEEAAEIAAMHSKAKSSSLVPVDYTKVRYVSKPTGSKPGMVIYVNQKTAYIRLNN